jgi:hypothetical protein
LETQTFAPQLQQDVLARSEATGVLQQEAFFDAVSDMLVDAGEVSEANYSQHKQVGVQVDGYGGPPQDEDGVIKLMLIDYDAAFDPSATITRTEIQTLLKRGEGFLTRVRNGKYVAQLEESSEVYALARMIQKQWRDILKIRFIVLTNRVLSNKFKDDSVKLADIDDTPVMLSVWDLGRMADVWGQGIEREPLVVDLPSMGYSIPALPANMGNADYPSYLTVMPADAIADIYDKYGTRLLEQNVRVYLQARGKVNKGIQQTILDAPQMFFAYNNGLTATVEDIDLEATPEGLAIRRLTNLQIVNGGQTAASIYLMSPYSKKRWTRGWNPDLSNVFVQMKISVVPSSKTVEVVPKISRFANSQNKVSDADFFSNHPFHVRVERFSQRIIAQPRSGSFTPTRWFYERMRGQYQNARSGLFGVALKEFDAKNPRAQVITKTDLAKFLMPWEGRPEIAQRGAAKCFMEFASMIEQRWDQSDSFCNEDYFRESVAKAILFRQTERTVSGQSWYEGGGNRAPIVIHTLGKLAGDLSRTGKVFPFQKVWQTQDLTAAAGAVLVSLTTAVKDVILNPPVAGRLPTEWAKDPECTKRLAALDFEYPPEFLDELLSTAEYQGTQVWARKDQKLTESVNSQIFVAKQGPLFWEAVRDWGESREQLTQKDMNLLDVAISEPLPTERQAEYIYKLYTKLKKAGMPVEPPEE